MTHAWAHATRPVILVRIRKQLSVVCVNVIIMSVLPPVSGNGGRYWIRTSDLMHVKHAL